MKQILAILFLFIVTTNHLQAQVFSLDGLINSAFDDPLVQNAYLRSDYIRSANMRNPNINEVELRSRSEDSNLSPDDIRLRASFTNFAEIREGGRYNNLLVENYDVEYKLRIHMAIVQRYSMAIDYMDLYSSIQLLEQRIQNLQDQIKVEKIKIANGDGDISDLANLNRNLSNANIRESELKKKLAIRHDYILSYYSFDGPVTISLDSLIQPSEIEGLISSDSELLSPELELMENELQLDLQETRLEKKESWGDLGFIQAEYERNPNAPASENLGYQVGITLPIINPDKARNEQNILKNLRQQQSLDISMANHELELKLLENRLNEQISQYRYSLDNYTLQKEQNRSLNGKIMEVKTILLLQENEIRLYEVTLDQRGKLLDTYLDWLDKSGRVSELPLKNFLYSGIPEINK